VIAAPEMAMRDVRKSRGAMSNKKQIKKRYKGWRPFTELNPASDEHANMPQVHGLFTGAGRCLIGFVARGTGNFYHPELAVIVNNWTVGLWREPIG
jgi:hypothetical protein